MLSFKNINTLVVFLLGTIVSSAQIISVSTQDIQFPELTFGQSDSIQVTVTNTSDEIVFIEELVFFSIYESSPFSVHEFPAQIEPFGTGSFYIVFEPVHNIQHNSELVIKTSGNRGAVSVNLEGTGIYQGDYYDLTFNLIDEDLKFALNTITSSGYQQLGYNDARDEMFMVIDNQRFNGQGSEANRLTRVYIGTDAVGYLSRADLFSNYDVNTEHTFPQGFFDQNEPMRSDIHHLFPTDVNANGERGNLRFGEVVDNISFSEGGSLKGNDASGNQVFEPRDEQKGAAARALLYFVVRYQNYSNFLNDSFENVLRNWNSAFPPNEIDERRNDDIEAVQNNRNPFIDYPQFLDRIWSFSEELDRPNIGIMYLSHLEIDFGFIQPTSLESTFNLVISNPGERFFEISEITVTGDGFSLDEDQPLSFVVDEGESASIQVDFDPATIETNAEGFLLFSTNLPGQPGIQIPLSASILLGLDDRDTDGVSVYPNPVTGKFSIDSGSVRPLEIQLFDLQGRMVREFGVQEYYDISTLQPSVYILQILLEDGTLTPLRLAKN